MRCRRLAICLLPLAVLACEDPNKKPIQQIRNDEAVLQGVNGAVNEVIRNSTDCSAAKPLMVEADRKIEEAGPQLEGAAAKQTLAMLKVQLDRVKQACP